ncbi:hypothetical protein TWF281_004222 [Arthrobotrys megalospora]
MARDSKPAYSHGMAGRPFKVSLIEVPTIGRVSSQQRGESTPPYSSGDGIPLSSLLAEEAVAPQPPIQTGLPTPPPSPQSAILPLLAVPAEVMLERQRKERQRLVFLRNAIELRRRHYARISSANKMATYIRQCNDWGRPIDWGKWVQAIPYRMEFSKRDPATYQKPRAPQPGPSRSVAKPGSIIRRALFQHLEDAMVAKIMGMLDYPAVQSLRMAARRFDDIYEEYWEDICDSIFERMCHKISYIPDLLTPAGSPEEDSEDRLRQHHHCIDWIVESVLPSYHEGMATLGDVPAQAATGPVAQMALNSSSKESGDDDEGKKESGGDEGKKTSGKGQADKQYPGAIYIHKRIEEPEEKKVKESNKEAENKGETQNVVEGDGAEKKDDKEEEAKKPTEFESVRKKITQGETFPFPGLMKYLLEKHLGSPRRSKDNLPRYQKGMTTLEKASLMNRAPEKKIFHWAMNLVVWHLMEQRNVYYAIKQAFCQQKKQEDEEEEEYTDTEVVAEAEAEISEREYVERLKWLKPAQLWELVRLVEVRVEDVIALMKVKGFLGCDDEVECETTIMEDFIIGRVKQVLET